MLRILSGCLVAFGLSGFTPAPAMAQPSTLDLFDEPRVMLYVHKAFGDRNNPVTAPRLGLRYERALRSSRVTVGNGFASLNAESTRYAALADIRISLRGSSGVWLANQPLLLSYSGSDDKEYKDAKKRQKGKGGGGLSEPEPATNKPKRKWKPILWTTLGLVAVACIAEVGICDGGDDGYTPPTTIPPTGE